MTSKGEMESREITTPKLTVDERQKAVLRVFVSDGAYHVEKTVRLCREEYNIPIAKDSLRKWLRATKVQDYIEHLQRSMGIAIQGIRHHTVQELALIAGSNIVDVIKTDSKGNLTIRHLADMPPEIQRTIKKVRIVDSKKFGDLVEIELHDKMSALRELSRISNATKVFSDADEGRVGEVGQLAGMQILPPAVIKIVQEIVEEDELDLGIDETEELVL